MKFQLNEDMHSTLYLVEVTVSPEFDIWEDRIYPEDLTEEIDEIGERNYRKLQEKFNELISSIPGINSCQPEADDEFVSFDHPFSAWFYIDSSLNKEELGEAVNDILPFDTNYEEQVECINGDITKVISTFLVDSIAVEYCDANGEIID